MNAVVQQDPAPERLPVAQEGSPAAMMLAAAAKGIPLEQIEKMMDLQERWEKNEARKAFVEDMTRFKAEPLEIFKRKQVAFTTRDGDTTSYKHAELSDVADVVVPALSRHGFSHRWETKQEGGKITVTCTVTHRLGHSESVYMEASPDVSGKKNAIQQVASTITYLQRYTLLMVTGLATKDINPDDDGAGSGPIIDGEPTEAEKALADWLAKLDEVSTLEDLGKASKAGAKAFRDAKDRKGYATFAKAVQARGAKLREEADHA